MKGSAEDNTLLMKQMRAGRTTAESVFVKFVNQTEFFKTHAFCFYEGEDGKYYDSRIRRFFQDNFITHPVGNRKQVLKLLNKINSERIYDNVCLMFFIDRDFDKSLMGTDKNLFETPCYSIENLYSQEECFKRILKSEFSISVGNKDYQKCLDDFCQRLNEFNQYMLEFNALVLCRSSMPECNIQFSQIKTSNLVNVRIDRISISNKYETEIEKIKSKIPSKLLKKAKSSLQDKGEFSNRFRGKNQLDFLVSIILNLKELNKSNRYFSTPLNCVHINITSNRLSELSQYAITPETLRGFIDAHHRKFVSAGNS